MIVDWIARLIVGLFWVAVGAFVTTCLLAFGFLAVANWQVTLPSVSVIGGLAILAWAFERNSDRKYRERQARHLARVGYSESKVYDLDQKLDRSEELL